ncbi:sulfurtransferase [Spirochaeta africana]|uniref:Sulfurtransferase n=1 Tax=Spirochaeta africana (strain ATCC 700263 / DSM 8902 / Z-7692) TaxID=889378 RepID=H9UIN2_SPIAZ|nr:sulfurtransferase [Spirochaeta africana]AFG37375.1 rhodanese-related sulfurtransferase [Spirochaeta africana DSM 8902]
MAKSNVRTASVVRTRLILAVAAILLLTAGTILAFQTIAASPQRTPGDQILVDAEWLEQRLGEVVILDSARSLDAFLEGHIPGAALVAREVTWETIDGIEGMLPDPELVAQDLADAGVSLDTPVVVYDAGNGLWASRLFWALEYLGHRQVHLLDGGFAAWQAAGFDTAVTPAFPERGDFVANPQPELIADRDYILDKLDSGALTVLDTRSPDEFTGADVRAERGGHIPGSINIEWTENVGQGRSYRPLEDLSGLYQDTLAAGDTVTLCQTGVRGAHTYVALRVLGQQQVRVYDGSWAEWGNDPDAPIDL